MYNHLFVQFEKDIIYSKFTEKSTEEGIIGTAW